ncbi:phosphoribosyltransferase-like protein [Trichophaea hybrida]|nr:phosphoribosyltransferase-like protein [Trichophaea hybrida]
MSSTPAPVSLLPTNATIQSLTHSFLSPTLPSTSMRLAIQSITTELLTFAQTHNLTLSDATLIPILRGGLPMYLTAQALFPTAPCVLVRCSKHKGTDTVSMDWLGRCPSGEEAGILLLDTVIASGDTLVKICDEIFEANGGVPKVVTVLSCYVSPLGVQKVAKHPVVREVFVGWEAEGFDDKGLLVPYPGDVGDKLYGAAVKVV